MNLPTPELQPKIVAWETTRHCTLRCRHCRGAAREEEYAGELSTEEGKRFIDSLVSFASPMLILTGGEPMSRTDIYELARHATQKGLRVVMAPCGPLITERTVARLQQAGVGAISVSLDGATAQSHDAFRGVEGAFEATLRGIAQARRAGLPFQINTTVTRENVDDLPALLDLAMKLGAKTFDLFFLVPTGRGKALAALELPPERCEEVLRWADTADRGLPIRVKTTCAPHFARVRLQRTAAEGGAPATPGSGCMAGRGFVFVSHTGVLQPCGFLDIPCGELRGAGFDFKKLYQQSATFRDLANVEAYRGKCGECEFKQACGGCRARAYAANGDLLGAEPFCAYLPKAKATAEVSP
jgi:heme b synthase